MATRKCRTCASRCYIIPESCLWQGTLLEEGIVSSDVVLPYLSTAQTDYLRPLLGKDCMDAICAAIVAFEDNPSVAIPDLIQDQIDAVTDLLVYATEWLYFRKRGFAKVTKDGVKFDANFNAESWKDMLRGMEMQVQSSISSVKLWIEDNRDAYPCLPVKECVVDNPTAVTPGFGGFDTVGRNAAYLEPN